MSIMSNLLTNFYRMVLFIHSYLPLLLTIFILKIDNKKFSLILLIIMLGTMVVFTKFLNSPSKKKASSELKIQSVNKSGAEVLNYFATYILPFIILSFDGIKSLMSINTIVALFIMFLILGVLYTSSNLYYINPLLSMFYDVSVCKLNSGREVIVIASKGKNIDIGRTIFMRRIIDNIYLLIDREKTFRRSNNYISIFIPIFLIILWLLFNYDFSPNKLRCF